MQLVIKAMHLDFYTIRAKHLFIFLCCVISFCLGGLFFEPALPLVVILFAEYSVAGTFSLAENNHFDKLYGTLPLKSHHIVIGRYLLALLIILLTLVIVLPVTFISLRIRPSEVITFETLPMFGTSYFLLTSYLMSIEYFFQFAFDQSKLLIGSLCALISLFILCVFALEPLLAHIDWLVSHSLFVCLFTFLLGVTFVTLSVFASCYVYRKRHS